MTAGVVSSLLPPGSMFAIWGDGGILGTFYPLELSHHLHVHLFLLLLQPAALPYLPGIFLDRESAYTVIPIFSFAVQEYVLGQVYPQGLADLPR